jgi:hypothetical protein
MPSSRNKPSDQQDRQKFLKRHSFEEGRAILDAAHVATHRLYCDALAFWRRCDLRTCKRHRRCCGEATRCLLRGLPLVPPAERIKAREQVVAGGPRRVLPATHVEWSLRRAPLEMVVSWGFG